MQIKFDFTEKDYIEFTLFHVKHSEHFKKQILIQRLVLPFVPILASIIYIYFNGMNDILLLIVFGIFAILILLFYPKYFYRFVLKNAKKMINEKDNNILGERTIEFKDEYMITKTRYEQSTMNYDALIELSYSDSAFYLFNSPVSAVVIPFRAFENEEKKQEFMSFIKSKIN